MWRTRCGGARRSLLSPADEMEINGCEENLTESLTSGKDKFQQVAVLGLGVDSKFRAFTLSHDHYKVLGINLAFTLSR